MPSASGNGNSRISSNRPPYFFDSFGDDEPLAGARDTESDAAAADTAIHDLGSLEARLARAVGAEKSHMNRDRAILDMFDEPNHRRQRDAGWLRAPWMKADACAGFGGKIAAHNAAIGEIFFGGGCLPRA